MAFRLCSWTAICAGDARLSCSEGRCPEAGLGIALLPDRIAENSEHLVLVDAAKPPYLQAWLVMHPDVQNTPAIRIISDAISSVFHSQAFE